MGPELGPSISVASFNLGTILTDNFNAISILGDYNNVNQTIPPPKKKRPNKIEFNVQEPIEAFNTGREAILSKLRERIKQNKMADKVTVLSQIVVLTGMRDAGKTEAVRKYVQKYREGYSYILWINSESFWTIKSCFCQIARLCNITDEDTKIDPDQLREVVQEIYDIVCQKSCLIVFDNADIMGRGVEEDGIHSFLPRAIKTGWQTPTIIVTSRSRAWKRVALIEIPELTETEFFKFASSQPAFEDSDENIRLANQVVPFCGGLQLVLQQVVPRKEIKAQQPRRLAGRASVASINFGEIISENRNMISICGSNKNLQQTNLSAWNTGIGGADFEVLQPADSKCSDFIELYEVSGNMQDAKIKDIVPFDGKNFPQDLGPCPITAANINYGRQICDVINAIAISGDNNVVSQNFMQPKKIFPVRIEFDVQDPVESFIGREDILMELPEAIEENKMAGVLSRVVSEKGGMGKTETVRKYVNMHKSGYNHTLWINAESSSTIKTCFVKIADMCDIDPQILLRGGNCLELVEAIYDYIFQKPCLIIFDNVETMGDSSHFDSEISSFLPCAIKPEWVKPALIIIATSRIPNWYTPTFKISGFSESECYEFLASRLEFENSDENWELSCQFLSLCEGLPLVLDQIVAVIRDESEEREVVGLPGFTLQDFLTWFSEGARYFTDSSTADSSDSDPEGCTVLS